MLCPLCRNTGVMSVMERTVGAKDGAPHYYQTEVSKPCAVGCKPKTGRGVSGNTRLAGKEQRITGKLKNGKRSAEAHQDYTDTIDGERQNIPIDEFYGFGKPD